MSVTLSNKKVTPAAKLRFAFVVALACLFAVSGCATPRTSPLENKKEYRYKLSKEDDTLIAATFSGGGMRAAALAYGALMALKETTKLKNGQAPSSIEESVSNPCSCYTNELENEGEPDPINEFDPVNNGLSGVNCALTKKTKKLEDVRKSRLIDGVDLVSSVSGGSVTAAYWALKGSDGLEDLKKDFLCKNAQRQLILEMAVNPIKWLQLSMPYYSRIDIFRDYIEKELFNKCDFSNNCDTEKHRYWDYDYDKEASEEVFEGATYHDLMNEDGLKRPYIILNTTDMATGKVFSFTQDMFDYLCADLGKFKLADAVAASAAYPVVLTALTVKNYWPDLRCKVGSQLKNQIQALEDPKKEALVRAEEQVAAKEKALKEKQEQVAAKEKALKEAEKQVKAKIQALAAATKQKQARELALAGAEAQAKEKKEALRAAKERELKRELDVVRAKEQVKAKREALAAATKEVSKKEQALAAATKEASKKEQALAAATKEASKKTQALAEAKEQKQARELTLARAEAQAKEKKEALKEAKERELKRELDVARAEEQAKEKKEALEEAEEQVKIKTQALKEAEEQVKTKEQALAAATKEQELERELDVARAEEQVKATNEALAEATKIVSKKEQALAEAEKQAKVSKQALAAAEEQVRAKREALAEATKEVSKKEQALAAATKEISKKEPDLVRAEEQAKATKQALRKAKEQKQARELALAKAEEQVKAKREALAEATKEVSKKEQALAEATKEVSKKTQALAEAKEQVKERQKILAEAAEQLKAEEQALVRAEVRVKAKKEDLDEAKEQEKEKKLALEKAQGKESLRRLQENYRALSARPSDYYNNKDKDKDKEPQYVHFLDGGVADNVGLTPMLGLLDSIIDSVQDNSLKRIAVIVVDARSNPDNDYGERDTPPCCLDTLFTTVDTAIDSTSSVLREQLAQIDEELKRINSDNDKPEDKPELKMFIVDVSLDSIKDHKCRRWFQNIDTNWGLKSKQVNALIEVGRALVFDSGEYQDFVKERYQRPSKTISGVCKKFVSNEEPHVIQTPSRST